MRENTKANKRNMRESILISPASKNNNCLFFLCEDILNMPLINRKRCNVIREQFNLSNDCPIPFSTAVKILNALIKEGKTYEITNSLTKETISTNEIGEEADIMIYLENNHHFGLIRRDKKKCEKCLTKYFTKHTCNPKVINHANRKILKNGKRHLITKSHKENITIKMKSFITT